MDDHAPVDEWGPQLSGRLLAMEVMVALLLAGKANRQALLRQADAILVHLESELADARALPMFEAAQMSLAKIRSEIG